MENYYLFPFRPLVLSSYGPKLPFQTRRAIGDAAVLFASHYSSLFSLFTACACTGSWSRVGSLQPPGSFSPGQGRAGSLSCSSTDGNDASEFKYPQVNTISFRCIPCFHFQVGFLLLSVGWFVMIRHNILFEVVFITSLTHYTNIYFSNHSMKCFFDAIEMDTNLMFGLIRIDIH